MESIHQSNMPISQSNVPPMICPRGAFSIASSLTPFHHLTSIQNAKRENPFISPLFGHPMPFPLPLGHSSFEGGLHKFCPRPFPFHSSFAPGVPSFLPSLLFSPPPFFVPNIPSPPPFPFTFSKFPPKKAPKESRPEKVPKKEPKEYKKVCQKMIHQHRRHSNNQPISPSNSNSSSLLLATGRAACQLEFRRSLLLLLLIAGAAIDQVPNCLAVPNENNNKNNEASAFYDQPSAVIDEEVGEVGDKRAGGRAFLPSAAIIDGENDKRGGGRAFGAQQKRAGARAFQSAEQPQQIASVALNDLEKRGGGHSFFFHPDEKRGGARPFFGNGFFGGGDGTWKRGGGRFFFRSFADNGFGNGWIKRGGGRHFSMKRGGGRSFFGGMDSLFDPSNYWASQRYAPSVKYPRRSSPLESAPPEEMDDEQQIAPPFFYVNNHNFEGPGGKRGGGRAFNADNNGMVNSEFWGEKRGGGRMFNGGGN